MRGALANASSRALHDPTRAVDDPASSSGSRRASRCPRVASRGRAWQYRYILACMAKVMVSIPDELLARLDGYARARGTTRSGLLRELAERELAIDNEGRRQGITRLLAAA